MECAVAEAGGGAELGLVGGVDGGGDSFGLGEVDFSVEEGAGGEFAGVGGADIGVREEVVGDSAEKCGRVGEVEFGDVLPCEGVR